MQLMRNNRNGEFFVLTIEAIGPGDLAFDIYPVRALDINLARQSILSSFLGNDYALELARIWMRTCLSEHRDCDSRRDHRWHPTRLLDVSGTKTRLIKTSQEQPTAPYATLSHCWGTEQFPMLTAENLPSFEAGLLPSEFPATFCDAIKVTKELGIRYLWIDSYCIIQSSKSGEHIIDKNAEISTMKQVYTNSILNIGATRASCPKDGLLADRDASDVTTYRRSFSRLMDGNGEPSEEFYISGSWDNYRSKPSGGFRGDHPLTGRGWVLQEWILCPRMLHFGNDQLFWECPEVDLISEASPRGTHDRRYRFRPLKRPKHTVREILESWFHILEEYSEMKLTYPTEDKLVAIGGVAQSIAENIGCEYYAGLFEPEFVAQLLWCRAEGVWFRLPDGKEMFITKASKAKEWRGPSWSWVSLDAPKINCRPPMGATQVASLKRIDVNLKDPNNKFGPLNSASLVLTARMLCKIQHRLRSGRFSVSFHVGDANTFIRLDIFLAFDDSEISEPQREICLIPLLVSGIPWKPLDDMVPFYEVRSRNVADKGISIPKVLSGHWSEQLIEVEGLLLKQLPGDNYTRAGTFQYKERHGSWIETWLSRREQNFTIW